MADGDVQMVRPNVDEKGATALARRLWGVTGQRIVRLNGYDDKNFWIRDVEIEGNPNIESIHKDGYVLKIMNSADSNDLGVVPDQNVILQNLGKNGVECPQPQPTISGTFYSMEQLETDGPLHNVRLLSFVPGEILDKVPWKREFGLQAGRQLAKIDDILQRSSAPALEKRSIPWSLWSAPKCVLPHISIVDEYSDRAIISEVMTAFQDRFIVKKDSLTLKESLIHGDYNEQNAVVRQDGGGEWSIAAVLDVGDAHRAPLLFEVALAATYMALKAAADGPAAADAALRDVVDGYKEAGGCFGDQENDLFLLCVCARLAQSLVLGLKAHREDPTNFYVLATQSQGWPLLRHLWKSQRTRYSVI